jgi:hypothetical protein
VVLERLQHTECAYYYGDNTELDEFTASPRTMTFCWTSPSPEGYTGAG